MAELENLRRGGERREQSRGTEPTPRREVKCIWVGCTSLLSPNCQPLLEGVCAGKVRDVMFVLIYRFNTAALETFVSQQKSLVPNDRRHFFHTLTNTVLNILNEAVRSPI